MLLMVLMLGVALLPIGDGWWLDVSGTSAICYFGRLVAQAPEDRFMFDGVRTSTMIISLMILFLGYLTRLIRLSKKATAFTKLWMRTKPGDSLKNTLNHSVEHAARPQANAHWRIKHMILETVLVLLRAVFDIYESTLWEVRTLSTEDVPELLVHRLHSFLSNSYFGSSLPLLGEQVVCFILGVS